METKYCKYCENNVNKTLFRKNRLKCLNCERADGRAYRSSDYGKQKAIEWSNNNKERHKELQSNWAKNHRDHLNAKFNERMKNDFSFKMKKLCQIQLRRALKNKTNTTMHYLHCNIELFIEWLEYCFTDEMTIDNHGEYWHLDHVIPISTFDLEDENQVYSCFHYLNYMPLKAKDNMSKNKKILHSQLMEHMNNIINFHIKKEIKIDEKYFQLLARHLTMTGNSLEF